ncbi:MAG: tripartite tricarboxylate transporter substrate binding protein [Rubrivivax sp.]
MQRRHATRLIACLPATLAALPAALRAQAWPAKPIRLVVPYPPGASTDAVGRLVGQAIAGPLGQQVLIDNKGGASGSIGSAEVAKAAPDGYTFVLGTDATHTANYHLSANPPYHPVKDFTPLTVAALNPMVLVVNPAHTPARTLADLVALVKASPDKGAYGSSGNGSPHHLAGELLKLKSGAPLVHVPYKGGGPAVNDLMGGTLPMVFSSLITVLPHIKSGRLHAVAVTTEQRYPGLPEVPTMAETYPGTVMNSWLGFFAPPHLPPAVAQRLSDEIIKALNTADVKSKLDTAGMVVVALSPAQTAAQVAREFEERGRLIRAAGIKAE